MKRGNRNFSESKNFFVGILIFLIFFVGIFYAYSFEGLYFSNNDDQNTGEFGTLSPSGSGSGGVGGGLKLPTPIQERRIESIAPPSDSSNEPPSTTNPIKISIIKDPNLRTCNLNSECNTTIAIIDEHCSGDSISRTYTSQKCVNGVCKNVQWTNITDCAMIFQGVSQQCQTCGITDETPVCEPLPFEDNRFCWLILPDKNQPGKIGTCYLDACVKDDKIPQDNPPLADPNTIKPPIE